MLAFPEFEKRFQAKKTADFTPLIDVIFNLLLFYLLTSSVMVSAFTVALPPAASGEETRPSGHTLALTAAGGLLWDNSPIQRADLKRALAQAREKRLTVEADASAPFGSVTELMDWARAAGFEEISFMMLEASP